MPSFKLTPEQISIAAESLSIAMDEYAAGRQGAVAGQIMRMNDESVMCEFHFVPHEMAAKIIQILKSPKKEIAKGSGSRQVR